MYSKRPRYEDNWTDDSYKEVEILRPSRVLQFNDLPRDIRESEIINVCEAFDRVVDCLLNPYRGEALVEFSTLKGAHTCYESHRRDFPIKFGKYLVQVSYSKSQSISGAMQDDRLQKVVHVTIHNCIYPITCDVLHRVCTMHGQVVRICVIPERDHDRSVPPRTRMALVEFSAHREAINAMDSLNEAEIYTGCCVIQMRFAETQKLLVEKNDDYTFDYTPEFRESSLLGRTAPSLGGRFLDRRGLSPIRDDADGFLGRKRGLRFDEDFLAPRISRSDDMSPRVVMFYDLPIDLCDCHRLFNLVCLYGNINKIKFLYKKDGAAMVEVAGALAEERIQLLNGVRMRREICVRTSRQKQIHDLKPEQIQNMPNGKPSFHNFADDKLNRFTTAALRDKYREQVPKSSLHFFNCPVEADAKFIKDTFEKVGAPKFKNISFLKARSGGQKKITGLIDFNNVQDAILALAYANNFNISVSGHHSTLMMCFAQSMKD